MRVDQALVVRLPNTGAAKESTIPLEAEEKPASACDLVPNTESTHANLAVQRNDSRFVRCPVRSTCAAIKVANFHFHNRSTCHVCVCVSVCVRIDMGPRYPQTVQQCCHAPTPTNLDYVS